MRKNVFAVWAVIAVVIFEQSAFARLAFHPTHSDKPTNQWPYAGVPFSDSDHKTQLVRVTDDQDAAEASAPSSPAFNQDSTRFFVMLNKVATLYSFDVSSLRVEKQGLLFDRLSLQADSAQWSAVEPDTILALDDTGGAIRINAYDVQSHVLAPVKDFSNTLAKGEARGLSKSWPDDNRFAFVYREAGATAWRYVIVWDRLTDNLYRFDLEDAASGVSGFAEARLDRSGESLIVKGDVTRVWRYLSQSQQESTLLDQTASGENTSVELMSLINDSPDRLPRNNVSRDGRFTMFNSSAGGSRSDVFIATMNDDLSAMSALMWTNILNCTADNNSLHKTGGNNEMDDARATSVQSIQSGDAFVEFTAKETNKDRWCGLNNSNAIHQQADDINFAIKLNSKKKAMVTENGKVKAKTKYKANNVFRIAIESGVVNYYKNGTVFYTSTAQPDYPLLVNASLMHSMSSVSNVMISGAGFGRVVSISPTKAIVNAGGTIQFTAVITGVSAESIIWSATAGTITSAGLYTAPNAAGIYTVTAASASNPSVKASAAVTVIGSQDTTPPVVSAVSAMNITTSGATISWTTNEASDTQVEYGTTTSYGSSTPVNSAMTTSHSAGLSGLSASTLYHYRVKSRDAAGNLATSGDQTFTTSSNTGGGGGGGGNSRQNVNWTGVVNCSTTNGVLQKTGGRDDSPDAGAVSQQRLTSGDGYLEFAVVEANKMRFCGLTRSPSGTDYSAIDFAIKLSATGVADVRENNAYKAETTYRSGDVFRISVESGVVKYYKNGSVFYTSAKQPGYPLMADASFINVSGTVSNAAIAATTGTLATSFIPESFEVPGDDGKTYVAFGSNNSGKNWPLIFSPLAMTGTPSSRGEFEADFTPSRKTFITVARRELAVVFSKEPCIIRG